MLKIAAVLDPAEHTVAEQGCKLFPDGKFCFHHDALSLLTAKETRIEMENCGVLPHWIHPQLGSRNGGTPFGGRPAGKTPEGMPWDCVLNNCLMIIAAIDHVTATTHLADLDPRNIKLKTPADITSACQRVPAAEIPSPSRIKTDVFKVLQQLARSTIIKARGVLVPGLGRASFLELIRATGFEPGQRAQVKH
jgi:hypothetical protein